MHIRRTWGKCLKQASWLFSFMSLLLLFGGNWGAWVEASGNQDDIESIPVEINLTGKWEIQEEDRAYQATLDAKGNGPYSWQEGRIQTEKVENRLWSGTWHQKGNDREGGFEVLLSKDGKTANGTWWYLRVGTHTNIPPRLEGGTYTMKRLSP